MIQKIVVPKINHGGSHVGDKGFRGKVVNHNVVYAPI